MCIAVFKPANQKLKKEILERCYKANGDGCGFAFPMDGRVEIVKGRMEFEEFWNRLDAIQNQGEFPMLAHFRIRSAGDISDENCHPFRINDQHALIHNGTIWDFNAANSKVSDTAVFCHNILKPLFQDYPDFFKTKYGHHLIEKTIGVSRIIILNAQGEYVIFNESGGEWDDNVWYSNKSYLPPPPKKKNKNKNYHYHARQGEPGGITGGIRKKKPHAYVALKNILHVDPNNPNNDICLEAGDILTMQNISALTHHFKKVWKSRRCKLNTLVYKGIIGPAPEKVEEEVQEMIQ